MGFIQSKEYPDSGVRDNSGIASVVQRGVYISAPIRHDLRMSGIFSPKDVERYHADGFLIRRDLFSAEEIERLGSTARADHALDQAAVARDDGEGNKVRLSLWNHPGEGIYGMVARCHRVVDSVEQLIGGEVYHYHSKMILKDVRTGGACADSAPCALAPSLSGGVVVAMALTCGTQRTSKANAKHQPR